MESHDSCFAGDGRAWKVDDRAQALVGSGLAEPLHIMFQPADNQQLYPIDPSYRIELM